MRIKCEIIKNLPVSIYGGQRRKLAAGDSTDALKLLRQQQIKDSTLVSSVYLDDTDFHSYHSRLRREDGAAVVRLRWYGERSLRPHQKIYVEKKVHREPWTGESGYKERCGVEQQHIEPYLEGRGGPPIMATDDPQGTFLKDTQQWISQGEQAPVLRTMCNRAAFQESSTNEVRISLDSQLHMVREGPEAPKQPGDWCRDLGAAMVSGDVTHFQYDVAEVKLSVGEMPAWLETLTASGFMLRVSKFSKYLHGVTSLYPNRLDSTPYWFLPADKEGYAMTPATWEELADPQDPYLKDAAPWLFPSTEASQAGSQSVSKSKQLVQRFNQAFWRKKGTTATSSSDMPQNMKGARAGKRAESGNSPRAPLRQPVKRKTLPEQPYTTPQTAPATPLQHSPPVQQAPSSQVGGFPQPLLRASSAASAAKAEPQFRLSGTASQAMQGRMGSSQLSPGAWLHTHSQGRALNTQQSAPSGRAEGYSPATWSSSHMLPALPTHDRAEEQRDRAARRDPGVPNWPYSRKFGVSASTVAQVPQQQQQQQQQQSQHQVSVRGNSRDYMVDMQALNTVPQRSEQTSTSAQHELGPAGPAGSPKQGSPQVAQQVPFFESSPEYLPTTVAIKPPASTRLSSYLTGLFRDHKRFVDVESGGQPTSKLPDTAPFRSGIFQNPRAADPDKPMSTEQAGRRARGLVRTRVEPKVFFANERTFLQWLQISVLLMFTGLSLLGGSGSSVSSVGGSGQATPTCDTTACNASKYAGVVISPIAILFMLYALFMYKLRTVQILQRANVRYDDQRGPVMLVILLIAATLASLVLTAYATLG